MQGIIIDKNYPLDVVISIYLYAGNKLAFLYNNYLYYKNLAFSHIDIL